MSQNGIAGLRDAEARRTIREALDRTLVVEAAAGTGKTTELVQRVVSLVAAGHRLSRMAAMTFTEKAAGELKLRLRKGLEEARVDATAGGDGGRVTNLERALAELETARIGTFHGFCSELLRERPVESGVDPSFEFASEAASDALLRRAFDEWFEGQLADPPECVRRVLARREVKEPREQLFSAARAILNDRDYMSPWEHSPFDLEAEVDTLVSLCLALVPLLEQQRANKRIAAGKVLLELATTVADKLETERLAGTTRDYTGLEALFAHHGRHTARWHQGSIGHYGWPQSGEAKAQAEAARDAFSQAAKRFIDLGGMQLAAELRELLAPIIVRYDQLKAATGRVDFRDALLKTRDLLRDNRAVREDWQRRFSHFFVDEFQDTDPLQAEILLLLSSNDPGQDRPSEVQVVPGKLFVVGDPKQSIYRFRRADVRLYERVKKQLHTGGGEIVRLTTSFRARPSIQRLINNAFAPVMVGTEDGSQAEYVPLTPFRDDAETPSVVALSPKQPLGQWGSLTKTAYEVSAPAAVASFVRWLTSESGYSVEESGESVPLQPRHIALLFRAMGSTWSDPVGDHIEQLERRGVPYRLLGGRTPQDREEIEALRNVLGAIEWPDDELAVYAALHGPFFAFDDDALLAYKHRIGRLHPVRALATNADPTTLDAQPPEVRDVSTALSILGRLHKERNRRPLSETLSKLMHETRAHAALAFWTAGEQALSNVLRVIDEARRFDGSESATSFRAFLRHLEAQAESKEKTKEVLEDSADGVRLLTVHAAKGLEFPVVILCNASYGATRSRPDRWVDLDTGLSAFPICGVEPKALQENAQEVLAANRHEAERLLYVAATRAKDMLVYLPSERKSSADGGSPRSIPPSIHHGRSGQTRDHWMAFPPQALTP